MKIIKEHLAVLKASRALATNGGNQVINRSDAEECVKLGLVEPMTGYPLTTKGNAILNGN